MKRSVLARALSVCAAAALAAPVSMLTTAPTAHAFTPPAEGGLTIVSNQNAGCGNDQHVVVANATTGAFSSTLSKAGVSGMLNDAKPFDSNRKVVAIWGQEPAQSRLGGVGIYDRTATPAAWTTAFPLPSGWTAGGDGSGLAHSVTVVEQPGVATPDVVVAQTGGIPGAGNWGNVVLFRPTSSTAATVVQTLPLWGVHGVEWDTSRNKLYAIGDDYIEEYSYDRTKSAPLQKLWSWQLKAWDGQRGGHDLRRRRVNNQFFVTTNTQVWTFNPDIKDPATAINVYVKPNTTAGYLGGGVKSIDERFDGLVQYSKHGHQQFYFTDGRPPKPATGFCMREYKSRWIYNAGQPVWNNDTTSAPPSTPPPSGSAERFLWERHWLTGSQDLAHSGQIWAGGGAGDDWPSDSATKVRNAITAGKIPYVKFYHWGDSGSPTMGDVLTADDAEWKSWGDYAAAMALEVGPTREATFIIEPEWDSNAEAPCNSKYQQALISAIGKFRSHAPKAKLINGLGWWDDGTGKDPTGTKSKYHCYLEPSPLLDGQPLRTLFDGHGFIVHRMSDGYAPNGTKCSLRHPDHSEYKKGKTHFGGGTSKATALTKMDGIPTLLTRLRNLFQTDNAYLTDVMVTRCGWNDSGQTEIVQNLVNRLQNNATNLYVTHGLRGVAFRDSGPPDESERYMGIWNEGMVDYAGNSGTTTAMESARAGTQAYLASISTPTNPPSFTLSVSNPASVAPGGTAPITLTVTNTGGAITGVNISLEVHQPSGGMATPGQLTVSNQEFSNTKTRQYTYNWPASAVPGTYRIKAGVFDSAWSSPPIKWNDNAGSIEVGTAEPSFAATGAATPGTIAPGGTTTLSATVTNNGGALSNGVVTLQLVNANGTVHQQWEHTAQSFASAESKAYSATWTAPAAASGTYTLGVLVTGAGGAPTYYSHGALASVTISAAKFTSSVSLSRTTVAPGGTSTVTTTVTNTGSTALSNGHVAVEFYDPAGNHTQTSWSSVNLAAGASATFPTTWTAPATTGSYTVKVGVFSTGWADTLHWNDRAASLSVAAATFDISASATPAKVMPGGPLTVTMAVRVLGGAVDGAIADLEIYDAAGVRVPNGQMSWSGQSMADGATYTYTWNTTAPATLATYTVKAGLFRSGWATPYKWVDKADTIEVANPSHTMSADVSSSTVTPGGTVTITANYTNNGGAMTNGILDLEIDSSSGTPYADKTWTGTSLDNGYTTSRSYVWTAPTTPGTYIVRLGVFSSDWSKQWGWNNQAATISVGSTFQPSFRVGDGANSWWFEVYTSSDVTSVDVIADDGRIYLTLPKKSWGAFAAAPPSEVPAGDLVRFIARRSSDGATAGSNNFYWLNASPTTDPGWACTFTVGSGASTSWVEVATSTATGVEVKVGSGAFTALTYSSTSGKWGKAMTVPVGSKVVFRATKSGGARAYSTFYNWLQ